MMHTSDVDWNSSKKHNTTNDRCWNSKNYYSEIRLWIYRHGNDDDTTTTTTTTTKTVNDDHWVSEPSCFGLSEQYLLLPPPTFPASAPPPSLLPLSVPMCLLSSSSTSSYTSHRLLLSLSLSLIACARLSFSVTMERWEEEERNTVLSVRCNVDDCCCNVYDCCHDASQRCLQECDDVSEARAGNSRHSFSFFSSCW